MEKRLLEVGDVLYRKMDNKRFTHRYVIARTTKTMAATENGIRFKREVDSIGTVDEFCREPWSHCSYWLETEELKKGFAKAVVRSKAIRAVENFKLEDAKTETLIKIAEIIKESEK